VAQAPTLVVAECVLVYLDAAESAAVVAALGALLPNAVFVVYEQVLARICFLENPGSCCAAVWKRLPGRTAGSLPCGVSCCGRLRTCVDLAGQL